MNTLAMSVGATGEMRRTVVGEAPWLTTSSIALERILGRRTASHLEISPFLPVNHARSRASEG